MSFMACLPFPLDIGMTKRTCCLVIINPSQNTKTSEVLSRGFNLEVLHEKLHLASHIKMDYRTNLR